MRDRLRTASRLLAWAGVWVLHLCVLLKYPLWQQPDQTCGRALQRAAIHCGWVCAAARLSRNGMPVGLAAMAAIACASPAFCACAGARGWARAVAVAPRAYPAGCAAAGVAALLAGLHAAGEARRKKAAGEEGDASDIQQPSSAAAWHPLGEPAVAM